MLGLDMNKMVRLLRIYMYVLILNSGLRVHLVHSTLQCLDARKKCIEDNQCSMVLKSIPFVCGSLLDSHCNSRDVEKCRVALDTLQNNQYFLPTCLCNENNNATCHEFRQGLFNHPCLMTGNDERLDIRYNKPKVPTCLGAYKICKSKALCAKVYAEFKKACKIARGHTCAMSDRNYCLTAFELVQLTPMYGCICTEQHSKKCYRLRSIIMANPCIEHAAIDYQVTTTTTTELITSTSFSENITTTPIPLELCEVGDGDFIQIGTSIRIYNKVTVECSTFCYCQNDGQLACESLPCVPKISCQGTFAKYGHGAPTYRAFRGDCVCFLGDFVCAKPLPKFYTIGQGVFLFVGYSEREERMIASVTELNIIHSYFRFQMLLDPYNDTQCKLIIHANVAGNLIFQVKLESLEGERENGSEPIYFTGVKVKEECLKHVAKLDQKINSQSLEIRQDPILSVIKLSTMVITIPISTSGAIAVTNPFNVSLLLLLLLQQILLLMFGR